MSEDRIPKLDPLVHAPVRLAALSLLAGVDDADFVFLRDSIGATDGNLSTHLAKLEEAGYVTITKSFEGKKPRTTCSMTERGRRAFLAYLDTLESIVNIRSTVRKED